ncbi:hypothetical protein B0H10DRAFT_2202842 [Mycena sp. CBHHK59/15]|nr:hypothetical protein B0H10DRAFT_2202842 [Mycena sp. CBHHK59/15]
MSAVCGLDFMPPDFMSGNELSIDIAWNARYQGFGLLEPRGVYILEFRHDEATLKKNEKRENASTSRLATTVPTYTINYHTNTPTKSKEQYLQKTPGRVPPLNFFDSESTLATEDTILGGTEALPFVGAEEAAGAVPSYETNPPSDEKTKETRQNVAHMDELKEQEGVFLQTLLSLQYDSVYSLLLGQQTPDNAYALGLRLEQERGFFEKHDFSRVMKINVVVTLGHDGRRCPDADPGRLFTLQLLRAGIFPGSVKEPKTGYTLTMLEYYRQQRSQGKGSAYNFVRVLQWMADPIFADSVPDIYKNFLAVTRFYERLDIVLRRGQAHRIDEPLPGEVDRPYPNRPKGYLGLQCAACPERGVNMPFLVTILPYLRYTPMLIHYQPLDFTKLDAGRNYKANLFYKRDDGSDKALTDGCMYFPPQTEFERIAKEYVVADDDKEVPCKAHIGSIRHQGSVKYGNTAVSGVIACACDHTVAGSLVRIGHICAAQFLAHTNAPPHGPASATSVVWSYDSWCSFVVNLVPRAITLFPEETWLHTLLALAEGQIPADHINGHGVDCQSTWQAVYFACRAHFHGETAEMLWAFLNPLGSSTRQMTGGARHDIINFVIDAWNTWKVLRQADLLAAEWLDALRLFELHMAVLEDLSRQHATEVAAWSRLSRLTTKSASGVPQSVYQHTATKVLTIENVLASLIAGEREKVSAEVGDEPRTLVSEWIYDGMNIERQQYLVIALLQSNKEHPLQDTWTTITNLRDSLNLDLKKWRKQQQKIYPHLTLSGLDADEPELTAIQLPSYRIKHRQRSATGDEDSELRGAETQLRCAEANTGILSDAPALVHLGYMEKEDREPYPPLSRRDTRRKETHLHRAKGDSRLFDGTAWYLQSGVTISSAAMGLGLTMSPTKGGDEDEDEDEPQLLTGTQTLKRSGFSRTQRAAKRFKGIAPEDVIVQGESSSEAEESDVQLSPSKGKGPAEGGGKKKKHTKKAKKVDGWIWMDQMTRGQKLGSDTKLAEYKKESERVQWFRVEAEMYRWLEQYERKHAEMMRVITRFHRDSEVWDGCADRDEQLNGGVNGGVTYARMQAAMYKRLENNAKFVFKSAESGAHHDWVSATTFDELVTKIDGWRDAVFKWMDVMGVQGFLTRDARRLQFRADRTSVWQ